MENKEVFVLNAGDITIFHVFIYFYFNQNTDLVLLDLFDLNLAIPVS